MTFAEFHYAVEGRRQAWRDTCAQRANEVLILAMQQGMKEREARRIFSALLNEEKKVDHDQIADLIELSHERARIAMRAKVS